MPHLNHCPERPGRIHPFVGGGLLVASTLLLGCAGSGSSTPAKPVLTTAYYGGTITLKDNTKLTCAGVVLADSATAGTVRLVTLDADTKVVLPYMASGAVTLNDTTITSNGSFTVFAPAGTTYSNGSSTTTCTFTGTLGQGTLTGTVTGPEFSGTFTMEPKDATTISPDSAAGTYDTTRPLLSDGGDASVFLAADGTFTGLRYPAGTLQSNLNPDPATATGSLNNGTAQNVDGAPHILRVNVSVQGQNGADPSDYSGLAVLTSASNQTGLVFMTDNGSTALAGLLVKR
jgi:hypothetical protein